MDGDPVPSVRPRRARRALLLAGVLVLFAVAVGAGVALDRGGKGGGSSGNGAAAGVAGSEATGDTGDGAGGTNGAGGQTAAGGGSTGGASSPTTTSPPTTTTGTTSTTVPPLQVTGHAVNISSKCTLSPAGYYDYTTRFLVDIRTAGAGILVFQWGRGADDVRSPKITRDIPPERQGGTFRETDVISGRAPSATAKVTDRVHILNPKADHVFAGYVDIVYTHSIC